MTIFGASIGLNMCFFRQTLLSVCLAVPFAVLAQPNAIDDAAITQEDVDVTFNITSNDEEDPTFGIDPSTIDLDPSSTLTIEDAITTPEGDFSVDEFGAVTFSPSQDFFGTATASYTVKDFNTTPGTSNVATITVTVDAVNDLPTITAIANQTIDEDAQTPVLDFTIGDVETDPALLTLTGASDNQALVPDANIVFGGSGTSRTVQVTPLADANGVANITVTVNDLVDDNAVVFQLTVTAINDVPTITAIGDQTIDQDESTAILAFTIGDVETAATDLTVTGASDNTTLVPNLNIDIQGTGASRTVQVTPAAGQSGTAIITITVNDGEDDGQTTFELTVNAVANTPPTITPIADQTISQDGQTALLPFTVGDMESAPSSLIVTGSSSDQTLVPDIDIDIAGSGSNKTVQVSPAAGQSGVATITLRVSDGLAFTETSFDVTVTPAINNPPTITSIGDQIINEDNSTSALAFTIGDAETAVGSLIVTKSSDNQTLIPDANIVLAGTGAARTATVTPENNLSGTANITITVDDGQATSFTTFLVTVNAVNDLPTITSIANQSISEDGQTGALPFNIGDEETTADLLSLTATSSNLALVPLANIILQGTAGARTVNVVPAANQSGSSNITLTVGDGTDFVSTVFSVTVSSVNDLPTITSVADQVVNENMSIGPLAVTVGDVETPVGSLTLTGTSNNTTLIPNANIIEGGSGANRTINITPATNESGVATITLTLSDGFNSVETEFDVTVNAVNDPPTISSITNQTIPEDSQTGPLDFTVGDNETPATMLVLTPTSSNLSLVPNSQVVLGGTGSLRNVNVIPNINQIGQTTITLEVSDGLLSATTSFNVMVTALDDPPTITPIADQVINEDSQTGVIGFTVGDLETNPDDITVTGISSNPTLIEDSDIDLVDLGGGSWTVQVTPNANQNGSATITLTVSDGTETTPLNFLVTVNAVNDVPVFTAGADQTDAEDAGPQSVSNWATGISDGDPELTQALTFNVSNDNSALFTSQPSISAAGLLTYTPAPNANGSAIVTVSLSDDGSGVAPNVNETADQTFTITLTAVNDAPVFTKGSDQTFPENAGAQSIPNWATGIGDGDPEVSQTLTFNVSNDNNALFSVQPAVSGAGTLTFTPAPGANGAAVVTVSLSDNGSGIAPNVNTSAAQTFNITITPINAAPFFTKGADQTISEDAGAQSVSNWATAIGDGDPEEVQTLTFNVSNNNNALFSVQPAISAAGTLTYTPAANANGTTVVTVTLSDDGSDVPPSVNTSAAQTFNITINAVNDAPVFVGGSSVTVSENAGAQLVPAWATGISDGDPELTQTLSFNVSNDNNGLFSVQPALSVGGNLSFTPTPGLSGSATVTVSLSDNGSGVAPNVNTSGPQTFTITVTQINDAPVFTKGPDQTINEDAGPQTVVGWATGISDGDPDQTQTLTFNVTNDNNPLFSVQPSITPAGNLSYTPAPNAVGTTTVTVTLSDDGPGSPPDVNTSAPQTFTILINQVNDAPAISAIGNQTINEDSQTGNLGFTISDPETAANDLIVTATSDNTTLVPNNIANIVLGGAGASRTINIIPVANLSGSATITINVSDGTLSTNRNFQVTVTSVNDPPTITAISNQTITEDTPTGALAFTIGDVETPVGALTVTSSSSNTILVPNPNVVIGGSGASRTVTVTPASNQTGTTTITVTVDDGTQTTSINFNVIVTPVDDPPTISTITNRTINEDTQTGNIAFTIGDPETAAGSLTVTASSSNTTLVPDANIVLGGTGATRTVNVIPAANQNGTVDITLNVSDGLNSTPTTFQVSVTPVNDAPQITNQVPVTINEGEPVTLTVSHLTILDPDNVYPTDFTLFVTGGTGYDIQGQTTIVPKPNVSGVLSVPVFVSDGLTISPIYQFQITVNSTNDAPQITGQKTLTILEDQNYNLQFDDITVNDPDNIYPTEFTMEILAGTNYTFSGVNIIPAQNINGSITVNVRVNDGQANSNTFPLVITVTPVNDPPAITNQAPLSTNEDTPLTLVVGNFTIVDPEPTTFTLTVLPSTSPDYTVAGNQITPALDFSGTLSVPVTVSDGALTSATYNAQVTVSPVNDAPQIVSQLVSLSTIEDTPITIQLADLQVTDVDNTYPTGFSLTVFAGPNYTFAGQQVTPNLDYVGPLYVVVSVSDGGANSPQFQVLVDVTDDADAPVINGQNPVALDEDTSREITLGDLIWVDPDTQASQLTLIVQAGTNYTLQGNIVVPLPNYFGTLTVPVMVNDGEANSNVFPLQVTVNSINDAPNFNKPADMVIQEDAAQQTVVITGISAGPLETQMLLPAAPLSDNPTLIPNPVITPAYNGTAPTATIVFKPEPNMSGVAIITLTFTDPDFAAVTWTFTVTVNAVNDAPTLQPISALTINEDAGEQTINLTGISPGGGPQESSQTLTPTSSNNNGTLFETEPVVELVSPSGPSGTLRFTPKPNANGTAQVTVRLTDTGPGSPPNVNTIARTFTLTITPINDLPEFVSTPPLTGEPGVPYEYNVDVADVDGETITLTAPSKPAWLTFVNGANGKATLSGTPPPGTSGDVLVKIEAKDATGLPVEQEFLIFINSKPLLTPITVNVVEDRAHTFTVDEFNGGFVDPDGNAISEVQITELPQQGTLTYNNNAVTVGMKILVADISKLVYTPTSNTTGNDTFKWTASDGFVYGQSDVTATLIVTPVNDAPIATIPELHDAITDNDTVKYELGSESIIPIMAQFEGSDPDGDNIVSAEVRIESSKYRPENEILDFTDTPNINGEFNSNTGVLTFLGSASAAEYTEIIRSVTYKYEDARELILDTRNIYVKLNDGQVDSNTEARPLELIYTFSDLDIPTAFTPNGDMANETWQITSANGTAQYDDAEIKVYNKRGLLLFQSKGFENQWDGIWNGEILPSDTYFYTIELNYNKVRYKGTVTILR